MLPVTVPTVKLSPNWHLQGKSAMADAREFN